MKKNKIIIITILILCIIATGCSKKTGPFIMTCTTQKENENGIESQIVIKYNFNEEQIATEYTSTTTQIFKDKSVYELYKSSQEDTISSAKGDTVSYDLKSYDDEMKLIFTMKLSNLNSNSSSDKNKDIIKASKILKTNEKAKATCTFDGINRNQIKD